MNVFVVFGKRSATLLYFLYIVAGGGARKAPETIRIARPNITYQNIKSNLI